MTLSSESFVYKTYDIVFVVEGTANLGGYFDHIKTSYILPILEYFSGGPPEEIDYGSHYSCTLYSMVIYRAADIAPEPPAIVVAPTTSTYEFLTSLDRISFKGGAAEACSHMAEGISTALHIFDDLKDIREPSISTTKHCILLCNSAPYNVASQETPHYVGYTAENLVSMMIQKEIHFSIISPRKMPILYKLFDMAIVDISKQSQSLQKNFAVNSRHMVLLQGFALQERPLSPVQKTDMLSINNKVSDASQNVTQQINPLDTMLTSPSLGSVSNSIQTMVNSGSNMVSASISGKTVLQNTANSAVRNTVSSSLAPSQSQPSVFTNTMNQQNIRPPILNHPQQQSQAGLSNPTNNMGVLNQSQMVQNTTNMNNNLPNQFNQQNVLTSQPQNISLQQQQQLKQQLQQMHQQQQQVYNQSLAMNPQQQETLPVGDMVTNQSQHINIWTGVVEWQEKSRPNDNSSQKINRSLPCTISVPSTQSPINASSWPNKLQMQMMPQQLLQPLQPMFRNSRTIVFHFGNSSTDTFKALYKLLPGTGYAGCIHMQQPNSDTRIIMLLYSSKKKQFLGLIPFDQNGFFNALKTVIQQRKNPIGKTMDQTGNANVPVQNFASTAAQGLSAAALQVNSMPGGQMQQNVMPTVHQVSISDNQIIQTAPLTNSQLSSANSSTTNAMNFDQTNMLYSNQQLQQQQQQQQHQLQQQQLVQQQQINLVNQQQQQQLQANVYIQDQQANRKLQQLQQQLAIAQQKDTQMQRVERANNMRQNVMITGQNQQNTQRLQMPLMQQSQQQLQPANQIQGTAQIQTSNQMQATNPQLRHLLLNSQQQQQFRNQQPQMQLMQQRSRAPVSNQSMAVQNTIRGMQIPSQNNQQQQFGLDDFSIGDIL